LLLNKFAIARNHILLTTKEFKSQLSRLDIDDFSAIFMVDREIDDPEKLFFFNCGSKSGASVAHKHIQMLFCSEVGIPIKSVISTNGGKRDEIYQVGALPFLHYVVELSNKDPMHAKIMFEKMLDSMYRDLGLNVCIASVDCKTEPAAFLSFNFLYFENFMVIVPRKEEVHMGMSVNSVGFAGLLLAKSEQEMNILSEVGPMKILANLAFPSR
jgi:sulfate adenylyltransferase (ADP) / ATP adenylyltransferase